MDQLTFPMSDGWLPAEFVQLFSAIHNQFKWNADYTFFRVEPLSWWDDASYRAFQSGTFYDEVH